MDIKVGDVVRVKQTCSYIPVRGLTGTVQAIKEPPKNVAEPGENVYVQFEHHVLGDYDFWYTAPEDLEFVVNSKIPDKSVFPEKAEDRKKIPVASGVIDYFPAALAEVAKISYAGNQQHNPGEPLHWARAKSTDQDDTIMRHFIDRGKLDSDGLRHSAKLAWRALALLQLELEAEGAPVARGAK